MELAAMFREFAQWAGPAMVTALWQGAALALALGVCLRLTPRVSAADRFRVWVAGFAALAVAPFLPGLLGVLHPGANSGSGAAALAAGAAPRPWLEIDPRWTLAIAGVWMAASLARAVDLGVHAMRLRRLWKRAWPVEDLPSGAKALIFNVGQVARLSGFPPIGQKANTSDGWGTVSSLVGQRSRWTTDSGLRNTDLLETSGFRRRVEVCATRDLDRPSVIGFWAPRILVPEWLLGRLSAAELEQVVLHETEHLRRGDDWTNLLQKLCLVVFPLNPALAWMERRLCREREMACDEGVVRRTRAPRAYAACLASLAERGLQHRAESLSLGAWRRPPELVERVHRILRRGPVLHPVAARALLGVVSCGLVFGSVELARCPQLVAFAARPAASETAARLSPATAAAREGAARMVNAEYVAGARAGSEFRAMDAVARVPSRAELAARVKRARWSPTVANEKKQAGSLAPGVEANTAQNDGAGSAGASLARSGSFDSVPVRSVQGPGPVTADHAAEEARTGTAQQWFVLTEWEEVESTTQASGEGSGQASRASVQYATAVEPATGLVAHRAASGDVVMSAPEPMGSEETASAPVAKRIMRQFTITRLVLEIYPAGGNTAPSKTAGTGSKGNQRSGQPVAVPLREGWLVIEL